MTTDMMDGFPVASDKRRGYSYRIGFQPDDSRLIPCKGFAVTLPEPWSKIECFVYHNPDGDGFQGWQRWICTESLTGCSFGKGPTKQAAANDALEGLTRVGVDGFAQRQAEMLKAIAAAENAK